MASHARSRAPGEASCFPEERQVAFGPWVCTYTQAGGDVIPVRVTVRKSGAYHGVFVDQPGAISGFRGCCLEVRR